MTTFTGYYACTTPCCGTEYKQPRYASTFKHHALGEYWTDASMGEWKAPAESGLCRCSCGSLFLLHELTYTDRWLGRGDTTVPHTVPVRGPDALAALPETQASLAPNAAELELAARLEYWWHLNSPYRAEYAQWRDAEDMAVRLQWEKDNPEIMAEWERSNWEDLPIDYESPPYVRPADAPFTWPVWVASAQLIHNLKAMVALHDSGRVALPDLLRAEIHRELYDLDRADAILASAQGGHLQLRNLMRELIRLRISGPWRFYLGFQNAMPRFVAH
ncbi:hypothetical protein [Limnohabitans sp.]|uniref:hypothetical protein n=1 Tax=Limnohabitans sp. TaxID=1907725 RepID=UPI0025B9BFC8|nr:hypothetical protein [Limnohabitans sp.]